MTKEEEKKANEIFEKFSQEASENDEKRIDEELGGMKKGPLAEIWDKIQLLYKIVKDPRVPFIEKTPAIGALVYAISPIDAIPDVIPGLGLVDDAAVIVLAIAGLGHVISKYKDLIENSEITIEE